MTIILDLYKLFLNHDIVGLESIHSIILLVVIFNCNKFIPEIKDNLTLHDNDIDSFKLLLLSLKNKINNKLNIFNFEINNKIFELYDNIIDIFNNNHSIDIESFFNDVFSHHLLNDNLSISKDYSKFYNNKILSKWIWDFAKPKTDKISEIILEGNLKVNSIINNINCSDKNYFAEKLFGIQSKNIINDINVLSLYKKSNTFTSKNITNDDVLINDIKLSIKGYDIIFYDFPYGIHNIIHANCCKKIKDLKIRGTKAEPLLLQLIMGSLSKNGRAYLIIPDSLLFSDSIQLIETRKYLLENFCVNKIIQIDEEFYFNKNTKNSILYFENKNKTTKVEFSKIFLNGENVNEVNIGSLNIDKIQQNLYSLYYKNYQTESSNTNIDFKLVDEIFKFTTNKTNITNITNCIGLTKYYKNESSIKYLELNTSENDDFETMIYIDEKTNIKSNIFMIKYLENNLKNKYEQFTKGKMNQFDIDKIKSFKLPILSEKIQLAVCNYLEFANEMKKNNEDKILMINKMKDCVMKTIPDNNLVELSTISELYENNMNDSKLIGIIKNGLLAGTVYNIDNISKISNNSHYLVIKNKEYLFDFVYHWLLYNKTKLKDLSNLTTQSSLNKSNLLSFKIPSINLEKQLEIISYCNVFESQIIQFIQNNKAIIDKDILSSVLKLNNI